MSKIKRHKKESRIAFTGKVSGVCPLCRRYGTTTLQPDEGVAVAFQCPTCAANLSIGGGESFTLSHRGLGFWDVVPIQAPPQTGQSQPASTPLHTELSSACSMSNRSEPPATEHTHGAGDCILGNASTPLITATSLLATSIARSVGQPEASPEQSDRIQFAGPPIVQQQPTP